MLAGSQASRNTFSRARRSRTRRQVRGDIPKTRLAELERRPEETKQVLPYADPMLEPRMWPDVLDPRKRKPELASLLAEDGGEIDATRQKFRKGPKEKTMRSLIQTYLRQRDIGRLVRIGLQENDQGDARGWAAVALVQLKQHKLAAQLASGPDGQTPCGYQTLRYVAHALAGAGAMQAAMHLSQLQMKCGRSKAITPGARALQSSIESASLYLQATCNNMPRLMAAHGQQISFEVDNLMEHKNDVLALTPHRRYLMFTQPFNQLIRWYGRARLVPQALRACEIMNELGIPRDEMTIHFLSKGAAQQYKCMKRAKKYTQSVSDAPGKRPEVIFIGRVNSGKSAMINALFSSSTKTAPVSKTRAWTRGLDFYEVNRQMSGLPYFMMVDTPGLGHAEVRAAHVRHHPDLIYSYLSQRQSLVHVFHLCDARNKRLLPADKQLIHLVASAQRRRVRYTIIITKIDVVTRKLANLTAQNIREELEPYCDVDIMFASAKNHRGVDQLWAKIWQSVTETPRGHRHRMLGLSELDKLYKRAPGDLPKEGNLSEMFGLPRAPLPETAQDFDSETWEEDHDFSTQEPGRDKGYFDDKWGQDLDEQEIQDSSMTDSMESDWSQEEEDTFEALAGDPDRQDQMYLARPEATAVKTGHAQRSAGRSG
eukprot:CAMPEP_0115383968 /NCGR_PEP_ID=MMETSP0271-20121206/6866_1 /TAXON_ID=71861 /ORGANISM="Scrippsiella trochoidea, Strain CCMP3099" /LENGTH=653 /DNA_ID=CAMNT_0002807309 /DNA_START=331 /DNA_END=2293 /DNA_ORIENTATION=+